MSFHRQRRSRLRGSTAFILACSAAGFLSPATASAQTAPATETVLISATPPDPVGNAAFSAVTLDMSQLQVSPDLDQSLRQVPGLSLFRRNSSLSANPTVQGVSLRSIAGSGAGRALVTLDGVPQNDPFGGWVIWSSLPAEDIQSAEIVRGAGAGPYGAGALTGVIQLNERDLAGALVDAEAGSLDQQRIAGSAVRESGDVTLGASGSYQKSGGWIPVDAAQRGAADNKVSLEASSLSGRVAAEVMPATLLAVRLGVYDERRTAGTVDAYSQAKGVTGSATLASPESPGALGWRAQLWFRDTDFVNAASAIAARRVSATPSNDEYATPALGWGGNAALRGTFGLIDWEAGADARFNEGEARELSSFSNGAFHNSRFSGGRGFVGGLYAEGASRFDGFLVTLGVRVDDWRDSGGHVLDRSVASGAVTFQNEFASRGGTIPTARAGIRKDIGDGLYLRAAGYEGFRAPSLNELYRPFRLQNNFTEANPNLVPERLYGAEIGIGGANGALTWDVTGFWNRLSDAISNVTIGTGPGTFPEVGTLPAGGLFIQRQNVPGINALGSEGEARWQFDDLLALRAAYSVTDARVDGGSAAPQLTGKRPSQTPRLTITGGVVASPLPSVTVEGDMVYESLRWSDDQNTLLLPAATTFDAKVTWHFLPQAGLYFAIDNITNAAVATSEGGDHVYTYDEPRAYRAGLTLTF
ncbi:MAG TPA: TonB-dependent receptor [Micropepsaceae bacterium]|nr:TonB-dependent receptor [Micropepsaceae bacterium]